MAQGMKLFENRQKNLNFDTEKHLSKDEIGMSRLLELNQFKHWLCNLAPRGKNSYSCPIFVCSQE